MSIIEKREIEWPDWDQRFGGNGPVRQIPLNQASPPPEEMKGAQSTMYVRLGNNKRTAGAKDTGHIGKVPK